ncbi:MULTISPECIES: ribonuclease J [unclassified Marinobacterium]|uniref:ribonuclease J n=1 Tax=unclassified Marinobacterium TaxID=2644139 RepID=UPI00156992EE|nr:MULTISPECIES: ribonuclease J [unclassified Marinobacterium]NRP53234.1 putative ribonuclease J [Marinobacterium sp. xm-v-242]NRP78019.1 putative ribonuclease J [Marinobacterium sp. xm-m-383]
MNDQTSALLSPGQEDLWFLPLGGSGEIGMNMNLLGHAGDWIMVDCGVTFDEVVDPESHRTAAVVSADPKFISRQKENLKGIVITHAHEDHLGALPFLWPRLKAPVYASPFAAEVLRRKLAQHGLDGRVPIHVINQRERFTLGNFTLEFLPITHSIPEAQSLLIETAVGTVLHTADWKIDYDPVIGEPFDESLYKGLSKHNIRALLCDSTNALKPGMSKSESICYRGILKQLESVQGRIVVSCFSSNLARLVTVARVADALGRRFALIGRSLKNIYSIAKMTGYWPDELEPIDESHLGYLPAEEVFAIATGSQGEERAALNRLALDSYPHFSMEEGDLVLMSSFLIPGNERLVERMLDRFKARKVKVVESATSSTPIHASGHPCQAELADMYSWVQPIIAVPLHGEPEHIKANAEIARKYSVPVQLIGENGDLYELAPGHRIHYAKVPAGRLALVQ